MLHRAAYRALGLDAWTYEAHEVSEVDLAEFLTGLDESWAGLSLTMPLKRAVLPLLDEADDLVAATGTCNTVVLAGGRRRGANTDVRGIVAALREGGADEPGEARVLGGGATAASAVAALGELGCSRIGVHVRDVGRAGVVQAAADALGVGVVVRPWPTTPGDLADVAVVVVTTPPRAADEFAAVLSRAGGAVAGVLLDVAYDPWPSALATAWTSAGGVVVPGVAMLLHQAADQVRLMTGREAPLSAMRVALAAQRPELLA